jgi:uncharacterized membrane protein YeiH
MAIGLEDLFFWIDRVGVFVFALSGGIAGVRARMDPFGVVVLAFLPAVGGGTVRDLLLDVPVFWLSDPVTLYIAAAGGVAAWFFHHLVEGFKPVRWMDAIGLGFFAAIGAAKAYDLGHEPVIVIIMGTLTATTGGLIRDVVANREPLLLKEEIYALAAMAGAIVYLIAREINMEARLALVFAALIAFAIRALAIIFNLSLPQARPRE